jgi:hypothetical protein
MLVGLGSDLTSKCVGVLAVTNSISLFVLFRLS